MPLKYPRTYIKYYNRVGGGQCSRMASFVANSGIEYVFTNGGGHAENVLRQ